MRVLIGADIVPTESNEKAFLDGNLKKLIGEDLKSIMSSADYIVMNLEVPLTDQQDPIRKIGANLCASTGTIKGLKAINPCFFGLANNHIMDQGIVGLQTTIDVLRKNDIAYSGAGKDLNEASEPFFIVIDGIRIGIYACAEHEYSIAGESFGGANPYDPLYSFDHVSSLRNDCEIVIVLYHGGKELYRYPSPYMQRVFRKFAESGADIVVAQHTHCIGCYEEYRGSQLIYGQGDFLFDHSDSELTRSSLLIQIDTDGKDYHCSYIPLLREGSCTKLAMGSEAFEILYGFEERSKEIITSKVIEEKYRELAKDSSGTYLTGVMGKMSRFVPIRILNKLSGYKISKWNYSKNTGLAIDNYLRCEAHRELLTTIYDMKLHDEL